MSNLAPDPQPARVLAVDDDEAILELLEDILTEHGYSVRTYTQGQQALAAALADPPDLILLDIRMPTIDGYGICAALKADPRTDQVPVIFVSGLQESFDKLRAFTAGAVDYITKPFDTEELLARVATHMALRRAQHQLQQQNIRLEQEIHGRRRAEQSLRESHVLQGLLDHAPAAIGVQDLEGRYLLANRSMLAARGLTDAQQLLGKTLEDFQSAEISGAAREQHQQVVQSGEPVIRKYEVPRADGPRALLSVGFPIRDESGAIYAVGGIATDITVENQLKIRLQRQIDFTRLIMTISTRFIQLEPGQIDDEIRRALAEIGTFADVDSAALSLYLDDIPTIVMPYLWSRKAGIMPSLTLPAENFAWSIACHRRRESLALARLDDLPPEARRFRATLEAAGVTATLTIPVIAGSTVLGGMAFSSTQGERRWSSDEVDLLRVAGDIFANALARRRTELELRQSEERFRIVWENAGDAMLITDPRGTVTAANPAYCQLCGYSPEEVIGHEFTLILPPEVRAIAMKDHLSIYSGASPLGTAEAAIRCKDGELRIAETAYTYLRRDGEPIGVLSMIRDVTERKRLEAELRTTIEELEMAQADLRAQRQTLLETQAEIEAERQRYRDMFELAPDGYLVTDSKGLIQEANQAAVLLFDRKLDMLKGLPLATLVTPASESPSLIALLWCVQARTDIQEWEGRILLRRAQPRDAVFRCVPVQDAHGKIVAVRWLIRDMTERNRMEAALHESRTLLRSIIDNAPALICAKDRRGKLILVNKPFWEALGFDGPQQLIGRSAADIYAPDLAAQMVANDDSVWASPDSKPREIVTVHNGSPLIALVSKFPIYDASGALVAVGAITTDITEQKQIERVLEMTNRMLFRRIDELSTLNSVARLLATVSDVPDALKSVCQTIVRLFDAAEAMILALDNDQATLHMWARAARPPIPAAIDNMSLYAQDLAASLVAGQATTLTFSQTEAQSLPGRLYEHMREHGLQQIMLVPLRARGMSVGIMSISIAQPGRTMTPGDQALAETIAGHVSIAIENTRLYWRAQDLAVVAERQRLARELHDSATQSLYSLILLSSGWAKMAEQGSLDDAAGCFRQIGMVAQQTLTEMRLLIHELRPPILEHEGLVGALQQRIDLVERRSGITVRLLIEGEVGQVPLGLAEQLFAIAQEALNNALRHANPSAITVEIHMSDEHLLLAVQDDGCGFDMATVTPGMGMKTLQERAEVVGAALTITTSPQWGTRVAVAAPIGVSHVETILR
jgi:PAS domain S-box-containing protein